MFQLYELNNTDFTPRDTLSAYKNIEIVSLKEKILCSPWKERLHLVYWYLITGGKARIYLIRNEEGTTIHSSYVVPRCSKFPFMRGQDVEIGPCVTLSAYRGQGLYPYVLSEIIKNESQEHGKVFMIVDDKNTSSIHGITKVGFVPVSRIKKDWMKRYVIVK